MPFDTATISYDQWTVINRTLCGAALELNNCLALRMTPAESRRKRLADIRSAQAVLSDIHRSTEKLGTPTPMDLIRDGVMEYRNK